MIGRWAARYAAPSDRLMPIVYSIEHKLSASEFVGVLERSGLAAPDAMTYYQHVGMPKAENAFIFDRRR